MSNPFYGTPRPKTRPRVTNEELREVDAARVHFSCKDCGMPAGFDPRGELIHTGDFKTVAGGVIRKHFSDHEPVIEIIEATGKEDE